jgi:hypothetical protein
MTAKSAVFFTYYCFILIIGFPKEIPPVLLIHPQTLLQNTCPYFCRKRRISSENRRFNFFSWFYRKNAFFFSIQCKKRKRINCATYLAQNYVCIYGIYIFSHGWLLNFSTTLHTVYFECLVPIDQSQRLSTGLAKFMMIKIRPTYHSKT